MLRDEVEVTLHTILEPKSQNCLDLYSPSFCATFSRYRGFRRNTTTAGARGCSAHSQTRGATGTFGMSLPCSFHECGVGCGVASSRDLRRRGEQEIHSGIYRLWLRLH